MAWYRMRICLLRTLLTGLRASAKAPWLSTPNYTGPLGPFCIANRKCLIQIACFVASAAAAYSALVIDVAVIDYFLLHQLTGPSAIIKLYALVTGGSWEVVRWA
jgi:hypothetical protein